jgi:anti-sigma-K factor RskA
MRELSPALRERLAAEYALGTLRGRARARMRRWMREDVTLEREVAGWEARLAPMLEAVPPVAPPARVWREVQARIGAPQKKFSFWKAISLLAGGALAALVAVAVIVPPQKHEQYVAVLSDAKTQRPVLLVSIGRRDQALQVKRLDPSIQVSDRDLELWALPRSGAPKSLGLVPPGEKGVIRLAALADQTLSDVPMLAISLEPKGGSTTGAPTGPVLYSGPCVKDW